MEAFMGPLLVWHTECRRPKFSLFSLPFSVDFIFNLKPKENKRKYSFHLEIVL
jgi:hypothetical protein